MKLPASALRMLGTLSLALVVGALVGIPLGLVPPHRPLDSYLFVLAMLAVVAAALLISAHLQQRQDPLAARAVPSSLVAYLLFWLMALRWLSDAS